MISVLIVDDERIIREGLKRLIQNKCPDFYVVGEATDGAQALKLTRHLRPQLAIVDIRMPGLNGIDYMHLAAQEQSPPSFIALTGYAEFEYARRLMGVGCEGYLLKPLKHAELIATMQSIAQKLRLRAAAPALPADAGNDTAELVRQLVAGKLPTSQALCGSGLDAMLQRYWLAALSRDGPAAEGSANPDDFADNLARFLLSVSLPANIKGFFCPISNETVLGILHSVEGGILPRSQMASAARCLREAVRQFSTHSISLGFSGPLSGSEAFSTAWKQCLEALAYRFYNGNAQAHFYDALCLPAPRPNTSQYERALLNALDMNDCNAAVLCLSRLLDRLAQDRVEKQDVVMVLSKLYVEIINALEKRDQHALIKALPEHKHFDAMLSSHTFFSDIRSDTERIILPVFQNQDEQKNGSRAVRQARQYIHTHMDQPVTLTDTAQKVGMNPSYFSMLFKKETGENFTNYVNRIKIEHAMVLLRQPACKVYQVCSQVGFEDAKYFAKLFRRIVGMTPSDYREGRSRKEK